MFNICLLRRKHVKGFIDATNSDGFIDARLILDAIGSG